MDLQRTPDDGNFGNGSWPDGVAPEWAWPRESPRVLLRRLELPRRRFGTARSVEEFELRLPITYRDDSRGADRVRLITVPDPRYPFTTDLTSVPRLFTWLVPRSGRHLPAALVHDGLVGGEPASYTTDDESRVDRIDADAIFRNGMHDLGVPLVRRWTVWAAVANASLVLGARPGWRLTTWWYRVVGLAVLGLIAWCGLSATAEVVDARSLPAWLDRALGDLPWIHEGALWREVVEGLAGAVVVPLVLAVLWGRHYRAGAIAGLAFATLFHVTVAVALVAGFYLVAEAVARLPWLAVAVAAVGVAGAGWIFLDTTLSATR